jgi:hypothetical protein
VAAVATQVDWRPPSALHEEDHLLTAVDGFGQEFPEAARKQRSALFPGFGRFAAEINQLDLRQLAAGHPAGQAQMLGEATFDQRRSFHRGGGCRQNHRHSKVLCGDEREVAGVVTRRFLLFVGGVVFLVDHDQSEVVERREEGGAGADDNLCPTLANSPPLPPALALGEGGVENRSLGPETPLDRARGGGRETDLGHKHETAPAARQNLFEARTGDALEEKGRVVPASEGRTDRVDHLLLLIGEAVTFVVGSEDPAGSPRRRLCEPLQKTCGIHGAESRWRAPNLGTDLRGEGRSPLFGQPLQDFPAPGGAPTFLQELLDGNLRQPHGCYFGLGRAIPAAAADGGKTIRYQSVEWSAASRASPCEQSRDAKLRRRLKLGQNRALFSGE